MTAAMYIICNIIIILIYTHAQVQGKTARRGYDGEEDNFDRNSIIINIIIRFHNII